MYISLNIAIIIVCFLQISCLGIETNTHKLTDEQRSSIPDSLIVFQFSEDFWFDSLSIQYYKRFSPFLVASAWKYDSTTCLKMRNSYMAEYLVEIFNIMNVSRDDVLLYLGPPNQVHKGRFYDLAEQEGVDHFFYFHDQVCKDGKPLRKLHGCWLDITIDTLSNKVVAINWPCI